MLVFELVTGCLYGLLYHSSWFAFVGLVLECWLFWCCWLAWFAYLVGGLWCNCAGSLSCGFVCCWFIVL